MIFDYDAQAGHNDVFYCVLVSIHVRVHTMLWLLLLIIITVQFWHFSNGINLFKNFESCKFQKKEKKLKKNECFFSNNMFSARNTTRFYSYYYYYGGDSILVYLYHTLGIYTYILDIFSLFSPFLFESFFSSNQFLNGIFIDLISKYNTIMWRKRWKPFLFLFLSLAVTFVFFRKRSHGICTNMMEEV